jgi:hypothetical protein
MELSKALFNLDYDLTCVLLTFNIP